jgi:hypothetical protein
MALALTIARRGKSYIKDIPETKWPGQNAATKQCWAGYFSICRDLKSHEYFCDILARFTAFSAIHSTDRNREGHSMGVCSEDIIRLVCNATLRGNVPAKSKSVYVVHRCTLTGLQPAARYATDDLDMPGPVRTLRA